MTETKFGIIESKLAVLIREIQSVSISELIRLCEKEFERKRTTHILCSNV